MFVEIEHTLAELLNLPRLKKNQWKMKSKTAKLKKTLRPINCGTVSVNSWMKRNLGPNLKTKMTRKASLKIKQLFLLLLSVLGGRFDRFRSKEKKENGDISTEIVLENESGEESLQTEAAEKV